jgi:ATP-dependent DNA helicase RecG
MPEEEYQRQLIERIHPARRWETLPGALNVTDLDAEEITRSMDEAVRRGRLSEPGTRNPVELLRGMSLLSENDEPLNAAVALFAQTDRLLPNYPQCVVRLARFRGTTTTEFEDNRQFHGNAFELLERAQRFLRDHLPVAGRVVPDLFQREDDPLYPPEALREALANAFCHRDYGIGGGSVSVAIFDDRLEISSTGNLPFGITVEDLKRPHPSRPWNPLIAEVFYLRGFIERWGRGTLQITELVERAGLASPEFEERAGDVVVRFFSTRYVAPRRIEHPLTALQREILETVAQLGPVLLNEIEAALESEAARRTVQRNLQTLRGLELVRLTGHGRGARWSIVR